MYADHSLRLAQEIVTKNFFLRLLRQKGKGGGKLRMIQNGGLAAGGKKIFFKLLRLGKLDKLFTHQIIKGNFPFPPPAQLQDFIYGCVTNDYLAKGIECVLDNCKCSVNRNETARKFLKLYPLAIRVFSFFINAAYNFLYDFKRYRIKLFVIYYMMIYKSMPHQVFHNS